MRASSTRVRSSSAHILHDLWNIFEPLNTRPRRGWTHLLTDNEKDTLCTHTDSTFCRSLFYGRASQLSAARSSAVSTRLPLKRENPLYMQGYFSDLSSARLHTKMPFGTDILLFPAPPRMALIDASFSTLVAGEKERWHMRRWPADLSSLIVCEVNFQRLDTKVPPLKNQIPYRGICSLCLW